MRSGQKRVVVTGMGMVTPVGLDVESTWESLREGRGGVGPITLFDAGTFATRIAAELKGFGLSRGPRRRRGPLGGPRPEHEDRAGRRGARPSGTPACSRAGRSTGRGSASTSARARARRTSRGSSTWSTARSTAAGSTPRRFTGQGRSRLDPLLEAEQEPGTPGRAPRGRLRAPGARTCRA